MPFGFASAYGSRASRRILAAVRWGTERRKR